MNTAAQFDQLSLTTVLAMYRLGIELMQTRNNKEYPPGSFVRHESNNQCQVVRDGACPPDKVALLFENGNVWWKSIEEITEKIPRRKIERSLRQTVLKRRGYKVLSRIGPWRKLP